MTEHTGHMEALKEVAWINAMQEEQGLASGEQTKEPESHWT